MEKSIHTTKTGKCWNILANCKVRDLDPNTLVGKYLFYNPELKKPVEKWSLEDLMEIGWISEIEASLLDEERFEEVKNDWIKKLKKFQQIKKEKESKRIKRFSEFEKELDSQL